jgi:hypothetical protein
MHWSGEKRFIAPSFCAAAHCRMKGMFPGGKELGIAGEPETAMLEKGLVMTLPPSPHTLQGKKEGMELSEGTPLGEELGTRLSDGRTDGRSDGAELSEG